MAKREPALDIGRRRRDLRALLLGVSVLIAAAVVVVVTRAAQPGPVAVVQAVPVLSGAGAAPTAEQPVVQLSSESVPQGGSLSVSLKSNAVSAAIATFNGRDYPMVESAGTWSAILGVGQRVGSIVVLAAGSYPVAVRYQFAGRRTVATTNLMLSVTATDFPIDSLDLSDGQVALLAQAVEASESAELSQAYGTFTPRQLWQGAFAMPVQGPITTVFGARRAYQGGPPIDSHAGIDIAVPMGTPVHASAAGVVAWTGQLPDRGNGVIVDHGLGVFTGYFHLSEIDAQMGQSVQTGDTIGLAGSTGLSTGPHVHWEVVVGGVNVDGLQFMKETLP